jgi:drug/metabolite transporter (DMT)-like permease
MRPAQYALAVVTVVLFGTAAGAFFHHKDGASYAVPILLALAGVVVAVIAWKSGKR